MNMGNHMKAYKVAKIGQKGKIDPDHIKEEQSYVVWQYASVIHV